MNGYYTVECENILPKAVANEHNTRGHSLKLLKRRYATKQRQHYFGFRVVNLWNMLYLYPLLMRFKEDLTNIGSTYDIQWTLTFLPIDLMDCLTWHGAA